MEAIYSSETSVDTQRTTRSYVPEYGTLKFIILQNLSKNIVRKRSYRILVRSQLKFVGVKLLDVEQKFRQHA
jgi:hypothetical protein